MVQPRADRVAARDSPRVDRRHTRSADLSLRDRGPLPPAGARARREGRAHHVARQPPHERPERRLLGALDGRRDVPDHHALDGRDRDGLVRPVPPHPRDRAQPGGPARRLPRAPRAVPAEPQHLRRALPRRVPARLVPGPRPRLRHDARRRSPRRQHSVLCRRKPRRDDARGDRSAAALPPAAETRARTFELPRVRLLGSARRLRQEVSVHGRARRDRRVARAAWFGVPESRPSGVRRRMDRRLRERGQTLWRLLRARVRHAPVHAPQLHRHPGRCVHAGARNGAFDAHHPGARSTAVHLRELHDLRRRGAVHAERGAAPRLPARPLHRPVGAHRALAARHRQHHGHVLHAGDVRRLRDPGAPARRGGPAGHGGDSERPLPADVSRVLRGGGRRAG